MHIGFLSLAADHSLDLLFNHGTQGLGIHDLLVPHTLVNALPNKDEASKISDLGANHLLIVRRLVVVDEPLDHLMWGYTCTTSSRHLWAYSWKDSPLFFSIL